jgi:ELWxxDGT repeat protein
MVTPRRISTSTGQRNRHTLTAVGNTLFFSADDGDLGRELWKSDGTAAGTVRVTDIRSGRYDSNPESLTAVGNTLFFTALDNNFDRELWKSDGTVAGTVRVADIFPGSEWPSISSLTVVGNTLFFSANDGKFGHELWKSDGTPSGTVRVADIKTGKGHPLPQWYSSEPTYLATVGNILFFTADDGDFGRELWKSDGTAAGTVRVADIFPGRNSPEPKNLTAVGNTLFFTAADGNSGRELWKSDGTPSGTVRVADISPGKGDSFPESLTTVGNTLFFTADDGISGRELWKSDGTPSGTVRLADILSGILGSSPKYLTKVGNTLFFSARDAFLGRELWKSDGTVAGTVRVADIFPGRNSSEPENLTAVGNTLFFSASDGKLGRELWKSDGTPSGTVRVAVSSSQHRFGGPRYLTKVGNTLFFSATEDTGYSRELWALDVNTDRTAPLLKTITVEGNQLLLGFSEAVLTPGLTVDRFAVTVAGANRSITAISTGATNSQLRLTLTGAAPTSNQSVRVRYTDLSIRNDERGVIQDAAGNDLASIHAPGRAADTFRSAASVTALAATTANLLLTGSAAINGTGNVLANTLTGNSAANILNGAAGADRLIGGAGNDRLNGGLGNDTLTGGFGADIFRFDAALSSTTNRDTITDFNPAQGDRIQLENTVLPALTRTGNLAATAFRSGSDFTSTAQRILYNPATGNLSYDSNGSASGGISAFIATLSTRPALSSSMLIVT